MLTFNNSSLLYSCRFSCYSAPIQWLVDGHMTSNNETVSRQMPRAGNIPKTMTSIVRLFKVIHQKKKFPMNFFETFPECSPPSIVSKKTIKMIDQEISWANLTPFMLVLVLITRIIHRFTLILQ